MLAQAAQALGRLRELKPLVHVIPNSVSAAFCADALSALGARPIMACSPDETAEITANASALVVSLGQPDLHKLSAIEASLHMAEQRRIPMTFDPVGAGASAFRRTAVEKWTALPWRGIIKGNASEIFTVLTGEISRSGVDSVYCPDEVLPLLPKDSKRCYVITGARDVVYQTGKVCRIEHRSDAAMKLVGTGCVAGCLCGAFQTVCGSDFDAGVCAMLILSIAGETASTPHGYGSFKTGFLDALSGLDESMITDKGEGLITDEMQI